jgi:hypothetical protein
MVRIGKNGGQKRTDSLKLVLEHEVLEDELPYIENATCGRRQFAI